MKTVRPTLPHGSSVADDLTLEPDR